MIIAFTRQLYVLIKAGIPLLKALQIIYSQLPEGRFKDNIELVVDDIQEGKSLSEALSTCPKYFSLFYINMIKAAEVSGNLVGILKELSQHLIQHRRVTRQIQAAFMYPTVVLVIAVLILALLLMFVLPVFVRVFEDLGGNLPATTLFLIELSQFVRNWGWLFLILGTALIISTILFSSKTSRGRYISNLVIWHIPLFGKLVKTAETGRFCRTLGTLLSSGVTLTKALEVLRETTQGVLFHRAIEYIQDSVEEGRSLSAAMEETNIFNLTLVRLIQMGEESGKITELFLDAAEDYEEEVSFAIAGLLSLLEPALIVIMGGIVGFIIVSLFFPILTISGLVK